MSMKRPVLQREVRFDGLEQKVEVVCSKDVTLSVTDSTRGS